MQTPGSPLVAAFFAVVGVTMLVLTVIHVQDEVRLAREGEEAPGVVVKRWSERKDRYADVDFTTSAGKRVRVSLNESNWDGMPKVDEKVRVRYARSDPKGSAIGTERGMLTAYGIPVFTVLFAGFCMLFVYPWLVRGWAAWKRHRS
ncbi:DUF3592 domain-containing protein [Spirillospora sp. CA-294931]|uniref:DUF3592 domain-containing protein n=1 Tax=Spirillospora sp. CA-294931 TaxID=3240042 RepID=UPI003D944D36